MPKTLEDLMIAFSTMMAVMSVLPAQSPTNGLPKDAEAAKHF